MQPNQPNDNSGSQPGIIDQDQPVVTASDRDTPLSELNSGQKPSQKNSGLREILSIAAILAGALVMAFVLITFVFQSYQVSGPSMQTTLNNEDHLIVWKVERTWAKVTHHTYIPQRGDVVIFEEANLPDAGVTGEKQLIKRVIGLPGERIVVKNSVLTVYNQDHPQGFEPDKTMPYGKVIVTTPGDLDVKVGANQLFVCGDNRINSFDSRSFGPIDANAIVGKLAIRVLPLNAVKKF